MDLVQLHYCCSITSIRVPDPASGIKESQKGYKEKRTKRDRQSGCNFSRWKLKGCKPKLRTRAF